MVDSISHGVVGIQEVREKNGKLDSILTSSIPLHKVMVVADRKNDGPPSSWNGEKTYITMVIATIFAEHTSITQKTINARAKMNHCT
jgi:hypothetical protein